MTREEAIEILNKYDLNFCEIEGNPIPPQDIAEAFGMAVEALQELPKRRKEAKRWKRKALEQEQRKGEWKLDPNGMDWNIPAWRCSECGFVASYIGVAVNGLGSNPMNWAGSNYCPNCGAKMDKE